MCEEAKFPKDVYIQIIRENLAGHYTTNDDNIIIDYDAVFGVFCNTMIDAWNSCHANDVLKPYEIAIGRPFKTAQEKTTLPPLKVLKSLGNIDNGADEKTNQENRNG